MQIVMNELAGVMIEINALRAEITCSADESASQDARENRAMKAALAEAALGATGTGPESGQEAVERDVDASNAYKSELQACRRQLEVSEQHLSDARQMAAAKSEQLEKQRQELSGKIDALVQENAALWKERGGLKEELGSVGLCIRLPLMLFSRRF